MLLGYADSPDAQRVVCPALDAAPVLARYPPADELTRGRSLGRRRGVPGAVWVFPRRTRRRHAGCGTDKGPLTTYALSVAHDRGLPSD